MKKIGIMTFHASLNCGSMLQAYALQTVLSEKYKADVEIINYSNFGQRNYYSKWDIFPKPSVWINDLKAIPYYKEIDKMRNDYNSFAKKYFNIKTKLLKKRSQLKGIDSKYDIVIAGGDQVWNVRCRDADIAYFLSFVKTAKKVAYSPSLGARNINKYAANPKKYANLINDFDFLSVRETNGQKWLKELTGKDIPLIADPTLLLTAEEWDKKFNLDNIKEDFILFYAFSYSNENNNKILQQLSKKYDMPIYVIENKSWCINRLDKYGIKLWKQSGPIGLLTLMKNAKITLVQSFHGIIFSTLFHKTFWSLRNATIKNPDDDRAKVILHQLGLENRAITYDDLLKKDVNTEIEYKHVDENVAKMRKTAFEYINSFMEEE